ncbi:cupin domain-containing protein [Actinokineospora sp.]|uniref:cupin domain-containing protein n=1 Tax=Actinokineospora sp. TaxID=1872133 RepID=UPI00403849A2
MAEHRGFHSTPATARGLPAAGGHLLAGAVVTAGSLTLIEATVPPGDATPLHRHLLMDESFYVLDGAFTVTCGPDTFAAPAGDLVHLPMGIPHKYVAGSAGGRMLILGTPAGLEDFFDDWAAGLDPAEVARKHHIEFLD